ncbi:MBL fold metallo-hydrolase [Sphingomonas sp.]|uniref:MBL fold metallo-hydrolase n=1 Tax=Sphingomonas sp. TaxID=28214 RepID=UPI00286DA8AC|nr:MBL fold metallo-hydrolase [Sphingomonas sp.]
MSQRILGAALAALCLVAASPASAAEVPAADFAPFVARQVAPRVHLLMTPADYFGPVVGNVTLIEQSDGLVIIDSGLTAGNGRSVVAYARSLSPKPVKAVAITHWHNDHPQGVSAIRDAWPKVRIIATSATEAGMLGPEADGVGFRPDEKFDVAMRAQVAESEAALVKLLTDPETAPDRKERVKKALEAYRLFPDSYHGTYIVPPTDTFEREFLLDDPELPVRLLHLGRANTNGDLVAWLPRQKIVASGDIVVAPLPFGFYSYPGEWIATIAKLKALGFTTLIPGHGEPQTDTAYLDKLVTAIADIRAQVAPLAKQGLPLDDVRKKVDFSTSAALFGTEPRIRANIISLFFDPMVQSAYKEALGQAIGQGDPERKPDYRHSPPKPSSKKHKS